MKSFAVEPDMTRTGMKFTGGSDEVCGGPLSSFRMVRSADPGS
jgi:hypothetical protein